MGTLLQLVQQATGEMGLGVPTYVAGNTAQDQIQQLALLSAVGYELQREFDWQALQTEYRFTTSYLSTTGTVASASAIVTAIPSTATLDTTYMVSGTGINNDVYVQSVDSATQVTLTQAATASATGEALVFGKTKYALASDFDRPIDRTQFDKTRHWQMNGPSTPQQWQWLKSGQINTAPRIQFRMLGGYFQIFPLQSTAEYIGYEYVSKNWARSTAGVAQASMTVDTDTCVFPDRLMVLGLKLKYFDVKGFDTGTLQQQYDQHLSIAKANDMGSKVLSMAGPRVSDGLITEANLPDTGFGT